MALTFNGESITPRGTGAVAFDSTPVVREQSADNTSTGAVAYRPIGTVMGAAYADEIVVRAATPGPVTVVNSWAAPIEAKVVEPPAQPKPKSAPKKVRVK